MPSKIKQFQFRNPRLRKKLEGKKINPDKFLQSISEHIESRIDSGRCPICGNPFEECDYFKALDEE